MELMKNNETFSIRLGNHVESVEEAIKKACEEKVVARVWNKDHTLWSENPDEITNRLGWLDSPAEMVNAIEEINSVVNELRSEGFTNALLLGMGGSSLAPEVFRKTFGVREGYIDVAILDSTNPAAVKKYSDSLDLEKTVFIVSTKSGGTVETISFMKYFYNLTYKALGKEKVGKHFIAITDPGSGLQKMAEDLSFRKIFVNNPDIGGRFSSLSYFGLVPAAMIGLSLDAIIARADRMMKSSKLGTLEDISANSSAILGIILGILGEEGKDKITYVASKQLSFFIPWIEQLIAESTGKVGKGLLPIEGEEILEFSDYSEDRLFVYMHLKNDDPYSDKMKEFAEEGFPVITISLDDLYEIGAEYFRWEFATAIASWVMKIHPFDQPNVESAKIEARAMMAKYTETGKLPKLTPTFAEQGIEYYSDIKADSVDQLMEKFFEKIRPGDENGKGRSYISVQAYLLDSVKNEEALKELRLRIQQNSDALQL